MANKFKYTSKVIKPDGKIVYEYNPLINYRHIGDDGKVTISALDSQNLQFDLEHPVDIVCQQSYDGSVNLILNDDKNQPRLINTRFTPKENNTYTRVKRLGNSDTNIYDEDEFEIDSSLLKKYINIPKINFSGVYYGGNLPIGNYTFYFKLADSDGNETDIVAESGLVTIHIGSLNSPASIRGGEQNENSGKMVQFRLSNIDSGYDYVNVYYSRTTGVDNGPRTVETVKLMTGYRIRQSMCSINITGDEIKKNIPTQELSQTFFLASAAKTQAVCQNMLFLGNVQKYTPDYETLSRLSLGFVPYFERQTEKEAFGVELDEDYSQGGYYNVKNIYNKVGYWNEEMYRFGVVYILPNGSLSPVYSIRGTNNVPIYNGLSSKTYTSFKDVNIDYDTQLINETTLENSAGVCRINDTISGNTQYLQIRNFRFIPQTGLLAELKKQNIKGYFFVRQKRIPTILCQAFMIGRDTYSGIPAWQISGSKSGEKVWVTETFLTNEGKIDHDYVSRLIQIDDNKAKTSVGLCPEYELNQAYYNSIFTGGQLPIKQVTKSTDLNGDLNHMYLSSNVSYVPSTASSGLAKVISVPDGGLVRDGNDLFRAIAGNPNELKFEYLCNKLNKPIKENFNNVETAVKITGGKIQYTVPSKSYKTRIVRGLYAPYLGIYNNNTLTPNSLVNIYIPGYDSGQMGVYFKIRINCEDPYYSITDRKNINELESTGDKIYRGDCYISQFTHRLNRNFQDPDAPNNDTIIDDETWINNYDADLGIGSDINRGDINAVKMGTYFTFKCYSTYNLAMRDFDRSYPSEEALTGCKRSFYPYSPIRIDGHYKIPESCEFNQGFQASTGERVNFLQPAVPYIKNKYDTRVVYSDQAQTDAFKNGFRIFRGISYVDYPNQYGGITKLLEWKGNLIIIFEHAIGVAQVNQNALIPTDDGTKIAVGAIKPLASTLVMISSEFGTQWAESVVCSNDYIYGIDTVGKKIWRTNGSSYESISDFKVQKFLNDNITLGERETTPIIGVRNVKSHYNANKGDIMFTYYDNTYGFEEKVWNLCYNEHQQAFVTFYSWIPSYSANIDNIFFSYDRNSSKWISKLGMTTEGSSNVSGVYVNKALIEDASYSQDLKFTGRPLPDVKDGELILSYTLERDTFGNYKYFDEEIVASQSKLTIKNGEYENLLKHILLKDPIIPCIQLNIKCNISVTSNVNPSVKSNWQKYSTINYGYYECQVFLTLKDIYDNKSYQDFDAKGNLITKVTKTHTFTDGITVNLPTFENDFWKHGFAGLIDTQEKIKPCYWYHKQHPFEFEYITGNDNAGYKQFDNITISGNNVAPESIHYTVVGDSYDFVDQKPSMYFRQEATKAFYQYNGSDILFDHDVFDYTKGFLPTMITSSSYIQTDNEGMPIRNTAAVSNTYRDTMFPLIYTRQDTFNEVEDFYKKITAGSGADYPNITGGEIVWDASLNQFSICNHVKARDIREVGRTRGNIQYANDKWTIQITPLNVLNRNNTWIKQTASDNQEYWLPKLVVNNVPKEVFEYTQGEITNNDFPPELGVGITASKYTLGRLGLAYNTTYLDGTDWSTIANSRKEVKLMDTYLKTRFRYKGDKLAIILAIVTNFNTIA